VAIVHVIRKCNSDAVELRLYLFRSCWHASCAEFEDTWRELVQTRYASTVIGWDMPFVTAIDDAYAMRFVDDAECVATCRWSGLIYTV